MPLGVLMLVLNLIAATCDAGVRFLQLTKFDDLVIKN